MSPAPTIAPAVQATAPDSETQFWNDVKASGSREYFEAYLKQYAKGKYVALAKIELRKLDDKDKAERAKEEAAKKAEVARQEAERKAAAAKEQGKAQQTDTEAWEQAKAGHTATA